MPVDARPPIPAAPRWCLPVVVALALGAQHVAAQSLSAHAKENKCIDSPQSLPGTTVYKCNTASGLTFFNLPENAAVERPVRRPGNSNNHASTPAPSAAPNSPPVTTPGLPRVDSATQKGRDDLRRRVLQDELAAEEKLLIESRAAYANGAPAALPEEKEQPQRYAERIARLRDSVLRHERNIDMLRRELGAPR
jgi:hypothetical protein